MKQFYKDAMLYKKLSAVLNSAVYYFIISSTLVFCLIIFSGFIHKNSRENFPQLENEQVVCLSLKVLIAEAKNHPDNKDIQSFAGIGNLNGYVIDPAAKDIIFFGKRSEPATILTLDDFVVNIRNIWNNEPYPYCSLDPLPQNILKLNKLLDKFAGSSSVEEMKNQFDRLKKTIGSQSVVTGGVPRNSRHSHTMIDADYHMKKVSQGLVKLDNVRSCLDITVDNAKDEINKTGELQPSGMSMSRFWFHIAEGEPIYQEGDGILYLEKCSVVILTERQRATADGELYDSNEDDPIAGTFAEELSTHFREAAQIEPSYANLENLYRLQALLKAIHFREEIKMSGLNIDFLLKGYKYKDGTKMSSSLPGLANYNETEIELSEGEMVYTYTLFPIVCGGVSMEMPCKKSQFISGGDGQTQNEIKRIIFESRPSTESLCWDANFNTY